MFTAILLALSLTSPEFLPRIFTTDDKATLLLMGIAYGLAAGIFEELGWTGFAIPALRLRYGVLSTGLIVGVLWAAWHLLVMFWASGTTSGALSLASYLLDPFLFLVVFRVLMVWVYDRTGSLLVAGMSMHLSLTASSLILSPLGPGATAGPGALLTFDLIWAAVLWVFVGAVAVANGGHLSRQPLPRRVA